MTPDGNNGCRHLAMNSSENDNDVDKYKGYPSHYLNLF
jgi:hypothetical protein